MKRQRLLHIVVGLAVALVDTTAVAAQEIGPENGSLVIVGGALRDSAILGRFLDLAGGRDAPIVVIPTAGSRDAYGQYWSGLRQFREIGATNLTVLHTRDRERSNSDGFVEPLQTARGVWFAGGRQWRLADAYLDTQVHAELWELLARGGVIGGTSAGATILGSYLARGDTQTNTVMMGDHEQGLAFLRNVAIDQHLLRRNRQFDLIEVIDAHPELLGIGIDENTAIVVQRDEFEVMGQGYVAIYDHDRQIDSGGRFYFLTAGDRFNLASRDASRPVRQFEGLDRVVKRPWP